MAARGMQTIACMWPSRPDPAALAGASSERSAFFALKLFGLLLALALPGGSLLLLAVGSYPQTKRSVVGS